MDDPLDPADGPAGNELDELRRFRDAAPGPDEAWVASTRDELLARADEELARSTPAAEEAAASAGLLDRGLAAVRRPAALATAAALAVVALAGGAVTFLDDQPPEHQLAQPGGGASAPSVGATTPPAAATAVVALGSRCRGPDGGFSVRRPEGWHTASGQAGTCEFFDEDPISADDIGGGPSTAITVRTTRASFEQASHPGPASRQLRSEPTTVAGRRAVRQLTESTGEAAAPAGIRSYVYVVDLGDRTLLAAAYDVGEGSFEHRRRVLDRMVDSLELPAGADQNPG